MKAHFTIAAAFALLVATPSFAQGLTVSFTTTPAGGGYNPKNIVAVWIQDSNGAFVKTIGRWAGTRKSHLVAWNQSAGSGDADAVSGATRPNHSATLNVTWDLKNKAGAVVPDGKYTIRMETCDANSSSASQNNQGTFTFTKGSAPSTQTTSGGGHNAVNINFTPVTGGGNQAPSVATAAAASPATTATASSALSVLGADDSGEAALTYAWAKTSGPGNVAFSPNGTNAAKNTTATFSAAGSYALTVTLTDAAGLKVTSAVNVTVTASVASVAVSPATTGVATNGTVTFSAQAKDQFGAALASQPTFTWTTSGGGTISAAGVFTAQGTAGGPFTITATGGGKSGTASLTVATGAPPTIATAAAAAAATVGGTSVGVSALGADTAGEAGLTYTWSSTGGPAAVSFAPNGSNAAKATTATFTAAGSYPLTVSIANAKGLSVTSTVTVLVASTPKGLGVIPSTATLPTGGTQQFTASAVDQFGTPLAAAPAVTWSVGSGCTGCSVTPAGLFTAGSAVGGPYTLTATAAGSSSASAQVTIASGSPPTIATAPSALENPVLGTKTELDVLGADSKGEPALTYTWTSAPAGAVFAPNGSNAAKHTVVSFSAPGDYLLSVTVKNAAGFTVSANTTVKVAVAVTALDVTPPSAQVALFKTLQLGVAGSDQFGRALSPMPLVIWSATGAGSVSTTGLFTAGGVPGAAKVRATAGGMTTERTIEVLDIGGDTTPPSVTLLTPSEGAEVSGHALVRVGAVDKGGIAKVVFRVDGMAVGEVSAAPYEYGVDTTVLKNGSHVIDAQAFDLAGNMGLSPPANVKVQNDGGGPGGGGGCGATGLTPALGGLLAGLTTLLRRRRSTR
ncbi:MAG: DUF2271 domain-containing protein [Myxococcaceae bacterium]|nr:DUF2271 domain-containing protein [Myxococcaceae bacterium]